MPHQCILPTFLLLLILSLSLLPRASGALTNDGLPNGQTLIPHGRDYFLLPPARRSKKSKATKCRTLISTSHPFFTLRNSICPPSTFTPLSVMNGTEQIGIVRSVSSTQLTRMMDAASVSREVMIALFHGGPNCKWSRQLWPIWVQLSRRMRGVCVVAMDASADSMMNYNLMVLGFPTIIRMRGDRGSDSFSGNRTVNDLVRWAARVGGGAPMDDVEGVVGVDLDRKILEIRDGTKVDTLHLGVGEEGVDWALVAANVVTVGNLVYGVWWVVSKWLTKEGQVREHED